MSNAVMFISFEFCNFKYTNSGSLMTVIPARFGRPNFVSSSWMAATMGAVGKEEPSSP